MRLFPKTAAAILVAAALAGCARERSAAVAKTGVEWLDRDNTPVNVKLTFDSTNAASAMIGEEGGVVSTSTADGSFFQLEIPKGALRRREKITMIPVSRVDGLPLEQGGAVASVQLEPEGLRFDKPAKLTIEPAKPVPVREQVGFAWVMHGTDTHLYPAQGDSLAMEMHLLHFSGYGFGKAPPSDPGRIHLLYASKHADRLEAEMARLVESARNNPESADPALGETYQRLMIEYFDGIIAPTMRIAETDDRMAQCALGFYLGWLRELTLLGAAPDITPEAMRQDPEMATRISSGSASALKILDNAEAHLMERAREGCRRHDLTAHERILKVYREYALLGIKELTDAEGEEVYRQMVEDDCDRWEVELTSSIDSRLPSGSWHFTVASTAKYMRRGKREEAPLNYVSLEVSGRPWKDIVDAASGGMGDMLLQKREGNPLRLMDFTLSKRGSRHGTITVQDVDWEMVERDTMGVNCAGRLDKGMVLDSLVDVTIRFDPPTEIVRFSNPPLPPHDAEMHEWMRFFMQFRNAGGQETMLAPDANPRDDSGAQPEFVTVRVKQQSPGVYSADFRTPAGVTGEGLSETGHLILRHTPRTAK